MAKVKMKVGEIEIECEGSEEFIKNDFATFFKITKDIVDQSNFLVNTKNKEIIHTPAQASQNKIAGTISTVASKLKVTNSGELIIAAAARFTLVESKDTFTRDEIHEEIKKASGYYKKNFSSNLSNTINSLIKSGELHETQKNVFSLSIASKDRLEEILNHG